MKKTLLISCLLIFSLYLTAQYPSKEGNSNNLYNKCVNCKKAYPLSNKALSVNDKFNATSNNYIKAENKNSLSNIGTLLGETNYDLQSNSSINRRILRHSDSTMSVVWTVSTGTVGNGFPDRGTGYSYFDGSAWSAYAFSRIEPTRTGFANIGILGTNQEISMSHLDDPHGFERGISTAKGSGSWTFDSVRSATPAIPSAYKHSLWGRLATGGSDGNTVVHLISNYSDTTSILNGVRSPMIYSRSTDGGATWPITGIALPDYDSTLIYISSAEDYAIDASGDNVVVLAGGLGEHVVLWKSTDNGDNFTKTFVDSFIFAPRYEYNIPLDSTYGTNDGSLTVVLDNNGNTHVAFAYSEVGRDSAFIDTDNPQGAIFVPGSIGLIYWNEITDSLISIPIDTADVEMNHNDVYDIGGYTTNVDGSTGAPAARYGNNSILHKPSIAVDNSGNIFIIFSMPQDADTTADGQGFRDIWVVASADSGQSWTKVQNITCSKAVEEAFASLAKNVDTDLHIVYQEDSEPGTALTNDDADGLNFIKYLQVNAASVLNGTASVCGTAAINELDNELFVVGQNTPNPFNRSTQISVILNKSTDVNFVLHDVLGKKIMETYYPNVSTGELLISINNENLKGMYFYTIKAGNYSITKKMISQLNCKYLISNS